MRLTRCKRGDRSNGYTLGPARSFAKRREGGPPIRALDEESTRGIDAARRAGSVLLIGNYRPSITVVRSLSRAGHRTIVGDAGDGSMAERSRHCDEVWPHPPLKSGGSFLSALREFVTSRPDVSILFPVQERAVAWFAANRERLPPGPAIACAASDVVATCLDKPRMLRITREVDVPHEPFVCAEDRSSVVAAAQEIGYPCIVRPDGTGPEVLTDGRKALICRDPTELETGLPSFPEGHASLLVQRFAPGPRHNVYFAAREGKVLARVEIRILRTDRLDGTGYAVEGISVSPDASLTRHCDALVRRLAYTGVGCAQFVNPGGGGLHFLELNPRLGANFVVVDRCGLDLPRIACDLAIGRTDRDPPADFRYPVGVRYAWTFGDLQALMRARRRGEIGGLEALHWLLRAVRAGVRADAHLTWSWRDPSPTLALYRHWAPFGWGESLPRSTETG